ncbi:MAG: hypothetical protein HYX48_04115 [Chlamydiales bacterium]|nr:hypothetical protein [Chlamydiales bacterium]
MVISIKEAAIRDADEQGHEWFPLTYDLMNEVTNFIDANNELYLENLGRRVIGALCYSALLVVLIVEEAIRVPISLIAMVFTAPSAFCSNESLDESWAAAFLCQVIMGCVFLVDGLVRVPSGLVQKCLFFDPEMKDFDELNICELSFTAAEEPDSP